MRRLQRRLNLGASDCASALVGGQNDRLECLLPQPWRDQSRISEDRSWYQHWRLRVHQERLEDPLKVGARRQVIRLPGHAVRLSEKVPSLGEPQLRRSAEEAATHEAVIGTMRLEDERLTRCQGAEALAAGAPEVDLIQIWTGAQEPVPTQVSNTYEGSHGASVGTGGPPDLSFPQAGRPQSDVMCYLGVTSWPRIHDARGAGVLEGLYE